MFKHCGTSEIRLPIIKKVERLEGEKRRNDNKKEKGKVKEKKGERRNEGKKSIHHG